MSLYHLSKDMLISLIENMNNFEKLDNNELKEKRKYIEDILIKRKVEKLDKNIEYKEIIDKHRDYFLSVNVSFEDEEGVLFSTRGNIIINMSENEIYCDPHYSDDIDYENLKKISNDLENLNDVNFLYFLREINI